MCMVSAVHQSYMDQFPNPNGFPLGRWQEYQEALRKARLYDEMMKQEDCIHPEKDVWKKAVEEFMRRHYGLEPKLEPKQWT